MIGDFSLNVANSVSAELFLDLGLERLTPTHDLNAAQVADTRAGHRCGYYRGHRLSASAGVSYRALRLLPLPVEGNQLSRLRPSLRKAPRRCLKTPKAARIRCWPTWAAATPFSAPRRRRPARHLDAWREAGIRHFRLEFVHESGEQLRQVFQAFASALAGSATSQELSAQLRRAAPQGVTEGSLFVPADYLKLPVLQ